VASKSSLPKRQTNMPTKQRAFAAQTVSEFSEIFKSGSYRTVPENAWIAVTDVAGSTQAIENGRYKDVNLAGAAGIAAFSNAFPDVELPFAFGGDGSTVLLPAGLEDRARKVLAGLQAVAQSALGLELRTALIPVSVTRRAGHDVQIVYQSFAGGRQLAMFSGGGMTFAEMMAKDPRFAQFSVAPNPQTPPPNLDGLSCRWQALNPQRGQMLTVLVQGGAGPETLLPVFDAIAEAAAGPQGPLLKPPLPAWPPKSLLKEARLHQPGRQLRYALSVLGQSALGAVSAYTGLTIGGFDGRRYRASLARHCDALKYSDGLKMVIDCSPGEADAVEARLAALPEGSGIVFGLHRSASALMTCYVRSTDDTGHVHFVDGADGGYALAAAQLKRRALRQD
jgi:hypothetical protein